MDSLFRRLLFYFRRRQFDAELEEEMQHHAALSGRPKFGNVTLLKEDSRAMWTWTFWEQLGQDLRYALRTMANNKALRHLQLCPWRSASEQTRQSTASWTRFCCGHFQSRVPRRWSC